MHPCLCVTVHRPALTKTFKWLKIPLERGGKDRGQNVIYVCPATLQALHDLEKIYEEHNGRPPWNQRRPFPEYARRLAVLAWG